MTGLPEPCREGAVKPQVSFSDDAIAMEMQPVVTPEMLKQALKEALEEALQEKRPSSVI